MEELEEKDHGDGTVHAGTIATVAEYYDRC